MSLWRLALSFLRIGATGFGGPMALIALMQERLVERDKAISPEDFSEGVAIGQILPGPIAVDCATHIGYRLRGLLGALVTTGALIAPPFVAMLILTPIYLEYGTIPQADGFFRGVRAAVVAVIGAACVRMGEKSLRGAVPWTLGVGALVATVLGEEFMLAEYVPFLLIGVILAAGTVGALFLRPRPAEAAGDAGEGTTGAAP
jgi:chromate transporter